MKDKKDLIEAWFKKADKDLYAAENLLKTEEPPYDLISFHCQQAVEKYLKGYLVYLNIKFEKIHDIGELCQLIEQKDKDIASLKEEADKLTGYAVEIRYPEVPEIPEEDAIEAIKIAYKIKNFVKNKLKL